MAVAVARTQNPTVPLTAKELLLHPPIPTNATRKELSRAHRAIEALFGETFCSTIPAVLCWSVLVSALKDRQFLDHSGPRGIAGLAATAYLISDALLCYMEVKGLCDSQPLYDDIHAGMDDLAEHMIRGKKAWKRYCKKKTKKEVEKLKRVKEEIIFRTLQLKEARENSRFRIVSMEPEPFGDAGQLGHGEIPYYVVCRNSDSCESSSGDPLKGSTYVTYESLHQLINHLLAMPTLTINNKKP